MKSLLPQLLTMMVILSTTSYRLILMERRYFKLTQSYGDKINIVPAVCSIIKCRFPISNISNMHIQVSV